jgi:hypothetical protein
MLLEATNLSLDLQLLFFHPTSFFFKLPQPS